MSYSYFALLSRMKYINRWALMRNAREENLSEHCLEVAILTHALCVIGNKKWNKNLSVEKEAEERLLSTLPQYLTEDFEKVFFPEDYATLSYENKLIKAADKLSALIKCEEELRAGNQEFSTATMSTRKKVEEMAEELPELRCFIADFLPEYGKTLDELTEE